MKRLLLPVLLVLTSFPSGLLNAGQEEPYLKEIRVTTLLKTDKDSAGQKISYPTGNAELTAVLVEIPVGAKTGWHEHPVPCLAYILEGELQVELANGTKNKVKEGEAFAEVVNLLHSGENVGTKPARLVLFVAGLKDHSFAVKKPQQ